MATYCNQHWLLSHIRNSFISTDETSICETVMISDDLPKHYLRKFQEQNNGLQSNSHPKRKFAQRSLDMPLQEVDFVCYPGLDQSDDEDIDLASQSFDIQMYPEVGAHRFRSYTAQKLEKMDIARRKAARTKCVNFDDEVVPPDRNDFFVKKSVISPISNHNNDDIRTKGKQDDVQKGSECITSKLSMQLANSPKQTQNKFMEYARFDGTSQTGIQTKRINVFLNMLPESERNYPIKICVVSSAKIIEVIGFVCYKATIQYPDIPLKSIRHYALYMTEDNDDMEDFPPLDNREPCSKFGFSHLTLAERRPLANVTRIDYHNNIATKSMTSEEDKARLASAAVRSLQSLNLGGQKEKEDTTTDTSTGHDEHFNDYEERMLSHNDMLEAPMYRTYHVHIIDKKFFKTEVTLGISGEQVEIDPHKNAKFWSKQKAITISIDAIAFCEIIDRRNFKETVRIWLKASTSSATASGSATSDSKSISLTGGAAIPVGPISPNSPSHYSQASSPFAFFSGSLTTAGSQYQNQHIRFKHYDFEADLHTAEQIRNKLNCILEVRSSEVRREFLILRQRRKDKNLGKRLK